jgi:predicted nucleic-acid-binding protein
MTSSRITSSDRVSRCVRAFADGRGDFADYVIREHARDAGYDEVATFDRALLKQDGFISP